MKHIRSAKGWGVGAIVLIVSIVFVYKLSLPTAQQEIQQEVGTRTLSIENKVSIFVEVSDTPEKITLGLSYRESLPANYGMLFIFPEARIPAFWMKGMNFPLDMIWIDENNKIVDITQNVPHPSPGTLEMNLPHYSPKIPAKMGLEVNGGFVVKYGIKIGDSVTLAD